MCMLLIVPSQILLYTTSDRVLELPTDVFRQYSPIKQNITSVSLMQEDGKNNCHISFFLFCQVGDQQISKPNLKISFGEPLAE